MGRQVTFFLEEEDVGALEARLLQHGLQFFEWDERRGHDAVVLCRPSSHGTHAKPLFIVSNDNITEGRLGHGGAFAEFDAGRRQGDRLVRGRVYFMTGPETSDAESRWANRLLGLVRRSLVRVPAFRPYRLGPAAAKWADETDAILTGGGFYLERALG